MKTFELLKNTQTNKKHKETTTTTKNLLIFQLDKKPVWFQYFKVFLMIVKIACLYDALYIFDDINTSRYGRNEISFSMADKIVGQNQT